MASDDVPLDMDLESSNEGIVLRAVQNRIKNQPLTGIPSERVLVQSLAWMPDPNLVPPPYVIVSPAPETTPWNEGTNERDTVYFGIVVTVVLANQRNMEKGMGLQLYWRQILRRAFQNKSIATFTELQFNDSTTLERTAIESGDKFIEAAKRDQRDAQYYLIRCKVREPRT